MPKNPEKKPIKKKKTAPAAAATRVNYESLLSRGGPSRSEWVPICVVFAVALAVRSLYFFINKSGNPLFYHPTLDQLFHHEWAQRILSGDFWGDEVFFRAPLYPYFLALVYKVSGSSIAFAVFVQHVIGSLSAVLVYFLARRFFVPRVALTAGILTALYWPLIYFEGDLLFETLFVFLVLAFLWVFTAAAERRSTALLFVSGLILGLGAITRPPVLVVLPALPFVFHFSPGALRASPVPREAQASRASPAPRKAQASRAASGPGRRAWLWRTAVVAGGALVFIMPVMARNWVVGRDIVPIASQGGVNFYIGNNPQSNGSQAAVPGARADLHGTYQGAIEMAEREAGRRMKPSEVSNYYTKKALDFILFSPGDAARLTLKKLYLFWAGVERSNDKYMQFFWERFGLGRFPFPGFWLVGPFALLGGVLLARRWRRHALLYLFVLTYMASVVAFFVNGRFRLPAAPVLIIFASYAFFHAYTALRAKSADAVKIAALLALGVFVVDYDYVAFRGVRSLDESVTFYELANASLKMNDKDKALSYFEQAHDMQRRYPMRGYAQIAGGVDFNLGVLYWEKGLHSRAIEAFERLPDADPRALQSKPLLADAYIKKGRPRDAVALYENMLRASPDDPRVLFGLGTACRAAGDLERARDAFETLLQRGRPPDGGVNLELARTLEALGDPEGALRNYEAASASGAQRRDAMLEMARLLARTGRRDKALETMERLRTDFPNDPAIETEARAMRSGR